MKKIGLLIVLLHIFNSINAQTTISFYKDSNLWKEVKEKRASFKLITTKNKKGLETEQVIHIVSNVTLRETSYLNGLPTGYWVYRNYQGDTTNTIDFSNIYLDHDDSLKTDCSDSMFSYSEIQEHVLKNFEYPELAREQGIQGTVYYRLKIGADGSIMEVRIRKGDKPTLECEVYRILNSLKKTSPIKDEEGKSVECYISSVLKYRLG